MLIDVLMPDFDLRRGRPRLGLWLVDVGETVLVGDGLLEVSTEGATIEVPSPAAGVLHAVFVAEDDDLPPGRRLAQIAVAS